MDNVFIRINKLDDYNPRTDTKKHYWFRCDLDIHSSRALTTLDSEQRWFFICLVGIAVKYRNDQESVPFDIPYFAEISKLSLEKIANALEKLRQNKTITFIHEDGSEIILPEEISPKISQNFPEISKNGAYNTIRKNNTLQNNTTQVAAAKSFEIDSFVQIWNETCSELPKVSKVTEKRRKAILARLNDNSLLAYWLEIAQKIAASKFCNGSGQTGWKADFDWFVKPDTHIKVNEGKYDNRGVAVGDPFGFFKSEGEAS